MIAYNLYFYYANFFSLVFIILFRVIPGTTMIASYLNVCIVKLNICVKTLMFVYILDPVTHVIINTIERYTKVSPSPPILSSFFLSPIYIYSCFFLTSLFLHLLICFCFHVSGFFYFTFVQTDIPPTVLTNRVN